MVTGEEPGGSTPIYCPSSPNRGPRAYGKLWVAWKAGLDSGVPRILSPFWSLDIQKLLVPQWWRFPGAGFQEGSGQRKEGVSQPPAPEPGSFCPTTYSLESAEPSALTVGLKWEGGRRGGLVHPKGSEQQSSPVISPFFPCQLIHHQCHQPAISPSDGLTSRRPPGTGQKFPDGPFQFVLISPLSSQEALRPCPLQAWVRNTDDK